MKEIVVATGNQGKLSELTLLLADNVAKVLSPADLALPEVVEDGLTFEENAIKKARSAAFATGIAAIADDSGLEVDVLGGRPGVFSARYAGDDSNDEKNNEKLLAELAEVPEDKRSAAFRCVVALCLPDGECHTFSGELKGIILQNHRGDGGFGYDPLFLVPEYGKTLAELPVSVKNQISHRGKALAKLKEWLLRA